MAADDPVRLNELEVPIADLPTALNGLRIAHISDLHLRKWDRVTAFAQGLLGDLEYDLLAATGDFGNFRRHWRQAVELMRRFFEPLRDRGPTYAVLGNHDDPRIASAPHLPLIFLRNESRPMEHRGCAYTLAGLEQCAKNTACSVAAFAPAIGPTVLLAHYPSTAFRLPASAKIALVLSGHTHGGQIRFPRIGCLWPNDAIPRIMARGLHRVGPTLLHVSPGIGFSLPIRVRINCPSEVAVLRLVRLDGPEVDQSMRPIPAQVEELIV